MALEKEWEVYKRERPGWVGEGKAGLWVVIHDEEVLGFFGSLQDAIEAGYERFGLDEVFMARQIAATDPVIHSSRRAVNVPHQP